MKQVLKNLSRIYPRSLLAEFLKVFGEASTEKLIDVFSGTTLEIPSRKVLEGINRDILIYEELALCATNEQSREVSRRLSKRHGVSTQRINEIFKTIQKQFGENKRFKLSDDLVGKLRKGRVKVEHRVRRRL